MLLTTLGEFVESLLPKNDIRPAVGILSAKLGMLETIGEHVGFGRASFSDLRSTQAQKKVYRGALFDCMDFSIRANIPAGIYAEVNAQRRAEELSILTSRRKSEQNRR